METTSAIANASALFAQWLSYWVIPAGMLVLYFYGRVHFNTPSYALTQNDDDGKPLSDLGRLVSMAPPMFTTTRSRFNRYAWRYILTLEVAFLTLLFLPSLYADIGQILSLKPKLPALPSSESLQYRTLFALFVLTGLLSSFPGIKEVDGFILKKLHAAAYIPADVTRLAEVLRAARFAVNSATREAVQDLLTKRDSLAVSRGESIGSLEMMLLKALWLRAELLQLVTEQQYLSFRVTLTRDIDDIAASWANLKPALVDCFDSQEKLIATSVPDIDDEISAKSGNRQFAALAERRQQLTRRCIALSQRMCLLIALLVYGTKTTPEEMGATIKKVGFQIEVTATPAWDWNTIASVMTAVFTALIAMNVALIFIVFEWQIENDWSRSLTRGAMLLDALVDTVPFVFVLLIAIRVKRHCRLAPQRPGRPENLLVAVCSFLAGTAYYAAVQIAVENHVTGAPLLLAVTPSIAGYFAGVYVDRSMTHRQVSWALVCWQALAQGIGTAMAVFFFIPVMEPVQTAYMVGYSACESAVAGFLIGYLFQRLYQRAEFTSTTQLADMAYRPLPES